LLGCKGIKLNPTDKNGQTPLLLAARHKKAQVAELLARNDEIDVEKPDLKGRTPMHWAEVGKLEALKSLLLKRGVKAETSGADGKA
jgi:ankyrin repeat protein